MTFVIEAAAPAAAPEGAIESPEEGSEVSGTVTIRGYAAAEGTRVTNLDVLLDGVTYGSAVYSQPRADLCANLPNRPNCPNIGFAFSLNTTSNALPLPNGTHGLQVRARDQLGRMTLIPEKPVSIVVNNPVNSTPVGVLTSPRVNERLTGTVRISGYAYDPDGAIRGVSLIVDGSTYGPIRYGFPREQECTELTGVSACPGIGFEMDLNTTSLANGLHSIAVQLNDSSGLTVSIPAVAAGGINVFVQN